MSYEDDRPILLFEGDRVEETPVEAEQRRGRERMLAIWRSAVECVTEAAQVQSARAAEAAAETSSEEAQSLERATTLDATPVTVDTWVFPTKVTAPELAPVATWVFPTKGDDN